MLVASVSHKIGVMKWACQVSGGEKGKKLGWKSLLITSGIQLWGWSSMFPSCFAIAYRTSGRKGKHGWDEINFSWSWQPEARKVHDETSEDVLCASSVWPAQPLPPSCLCSGTQQSAEHCTKWTTGELITTMQVRSDWLMPHSSCCIRDVFLKNC